jgi:hypothetical protein
VGSIKVNTSVKYTISVAVLAAILGAPLISAQTPNPPPRKPAREQPERRVPKFYRDDPLMRVVDTEDASKVEERELALYYDAVINLFGRPGQQLVDRAESVNSIDEVPDSSWFTNRLGYQPMSTEELVRGPQTGKGPAGGPWTIVGGKSEGISPGLTMKDSEGVLYFVKFDPPAYPEMATGAEVVASQFFHAFGYHLPENYIAVLRRENLRIDPEATLRGPDGKRRPFTNADLDVILEKAAGRPDGSYRVVASKGLPGKPLGPFRYWGTRPDDPNDIFPHEHRRELRGLRVFSAWLNHDDSRAVNTADFLIERDGRSIVWHNLIDFGSTLGSGSTQAQKPRAGNEYIWEARPTFITMLTLGFYVRPWIKVKYSELPAVGRIEGEYFQPDRWKPEYPNRAFKNLRADDAFWGASRVMMISDDAIRAVVGTGEYTDPVAAEYLTQVLISRRDKIGRLWLNGVLPLVDPKLTENTLRLRNVSVETRMADPPTEYRVRWFQFDNATGAATPVGDEERVTEPESKAPRAVLEGEYLMTEWRGVHPAHPGWSTPLRVYFRREAGVWHPVGIVRQ